MGWMVQGSNLSGGGGGGGFSSKPTPRPTKHPIQWAPDLFPEALTTHCFLVPGSSMGYSYTSVYLPSMPAWHASHFKLFVMYRVTGVSQDSSVTAVTRLHAD